MAHKNLSLAGRARFDRATIDNALLWLLIAALGWVPFWFGSNGVLPWAVNAILFPGIAMAYEISLLTRRERHAVGIRHVALPASMFVAVVIWIAVQASTWTPSMLHHPIWVMATEALGQPVAGSISVNRDATHLALVRLLTAASAFWISLQLCRDAQRANRLLLAVAVIVCGYAIYGLAAYALTPGYTLWAENGFARGALTSTFLNRNSYAAFAGIGIVIVIAALLQRYGRTRTRPLKLQIAEAIERSGGRGAFLIGALVIILVSSVLSGSRAGMVCTVLGAVSLLALVKLRDGHSAQRSEPIVVAVLIVSAILLFFGDAFLASISERGLSDPRRWAVYRIVVSSIWDAPLTGHGYGTFADVFPMFRDRSLDVLGRWEMAHNTYLEVIQGLGLIFGGLLIGAVVILVWRCVEGAMRRRENSVVPRVAASVSALLGLHSLIDFSLQIQATSLIYAAILGAGVAQASSSRDALAD